MQDILAIVETEIAALRAEGARTDTRHDLFLLEVLHAGLTIVIEIGATVLPYATRRDPEAADRLAPLIDAVRAEGSALTLYHARGSRQPLGDLVQLMLRGLRDALDARIPPCGATWGGRAEEDVAAIQAWGSTPEPMGARLWTACYPFMRPRYA